MLNSDALADKEVQEPADCKRAKPALPALSTGSTSSAVGRWGTEKTGTRQQLMQSLRHEQLWAETAIGFDPDQVNLTGLESGLVTVF